MKVAFILPNTTNRAIGGYKVIYQYANYVKKSGHSVSIIYDEEQMLRGHSVVLSPVIKTRARFFLLTEPKWFPLDGEIKKKSVSKITARKLRDYDVVVATAKITADYIHRENINPKKVIYLIQDFENWGCSEESVYSSYQYGYMNVAISKRLVDIVKTKAGVPCQYLPDGIDTGCFKIFNPIEKRPLHSIAMMYRKSTRKGYPDGLAVLKKLKKTYSDLDVVVFGVDKRPEDLPEWVKYRYRANPEQVSAIYNSVRVFLCSSLQEGYGLTGLESMACGCALVSTDTMGVHEYAIDGQTASIVPVSDIEEMHKKVCELFEDEELLVRRTKQSANEAQKYGVELMGQRFESMLMKVEIDNVHN